MNGVLSYRVNESQASRARQIILVAATLLLASAIHAATTDTLRIEATTPKNEYRIGDQIEYTITVEWKAPVQLIRIEPSEALGAFEIVRPAEYKDARLRGGWQQERTRYVLSTFETGDFTIPEFTVVYREADGSEQRVPTPPVQIRVLSVSPAQSGETEIRDVKPPAVPPIRWPSKKVIIAAAAALLLAIILVVAAVRAIQKRHRGLAPLLPPRPIEEVAREELARVAQSDLLARGLIKEYFDQISDIIRVYLGRRYGFEGIVTTTTELLDALHDRLSDDGRLGRVAEFSEQADWAKFAKWLPDREICDRFLETAYRVVDETTQPVAVARDDGGGQVSRSG